ncbi:MAG TPA: polysaccharide deacetylase family protein [Lacipirellula sp.]
MNTTMKMFDPAIVRRVGLLGSTRCVASALLVLAAGADAALAAAPPLRTYTQEFTITLASAQDAAKATLTPLPVFDGKTWALSARWDDNHPGSLKMREVMAKHGLKGTFYVNHADAGSRYGQRFVDELTRDGFTIGGHSQSHPFFPTLTPNMLFVEVLANRVEREDQADTPVVSFAFPFGVWSSEYDPAAAARITEALRRAGLHHNTYNQFARENPNAGEYEFSTCNLIQPGDHQINREKFETNLEKFFKFTEAFQAMSHNISLSTHARQQGAAWNDLDALLADLVTRADWWICNQNEYAAYFQQVHRSTIERVSVEGTVARFRITRPIPADGGAVVPLTVAVDGEVTAVDGAGAKHTWRVSSGRTLINLAHDADQTLPASIDAVDNPDNTDATSGRDEAAELPGLRAWLCYDAGADRLLLDLANAGEALTDVEATLLLPLAYEPGAKRVSLEDLSGGARQEVFDLDGRSSDPIFNDGPLYFVVQLDFRRGGERGRLFVTTTQPQPSSPRACVRDAAKMMGPIDLTDADLDRLREQSRPGTALTDAGDTPNARWFRASVGDRAQFLGERLTLFRDDTAWLEATKPFNRRAHAFVACLDFRLDVAGPATLASETPIAHLFLNGEPVSADQPLDAARAGDNRLVVVFDIPASRIYWKPMPAWFELRADTSELTYLLPTE